MTQTSTTSTTQNNDAAVLVQRLADHIALVTLNRPQARNAVNGAVAQALQAAVDQTEADPNVWVVVLTGAGPDVFCAGADLKEVSAGRSALLRTERSGFAGFVYGERSKPWIAAVNGKALAGGCEIALACDLIVASDHAAFGLPEVLRGLMAAAGGVFRLPRALPPKIAIELILTAGQIDAQRALAFGLVNAVVPRAQLLSEAQALAQLHQWGGRPLPVNASAWWDGMLLVRLCGARAAVDAAVASLGGERIEGALAQPFWEGLRDHEDEFFARARAAVTAHPAGALWRLSLPQTARPILLPGAQLIEWGGAQRWWCTTASAQTVRAAAKRGGGHATLFRGGDKSVGAFTPLAPPLARIHHGLKREFDPHGVFNRGRLYPEF